MNWDFGCFLDGLHGFSNSLFIGTMIIGGFNHSVSTRLPFSHLTLLLVPHCDRMDTHYRKAIFVKVCVSFVVYKLVQKVTLLQCSKLFSIGNSIVARILQDAIFTINVEILHKINFPKKELLQNTMEEFFELPPSLVLWVLLMAPTYTFANPLLVFI